MKFIYNENKEVIAEETGGKIKRLIRGYDLWASECTHEKTWYHYASDEQGSIVFITDDKEVRNRYEYDAWGNETVSEEQIENRYRYTGQQYDPITQQYYLRARYYNPVIARFTQEDEYRGDGLNLYAYCDNNPVMYFDPSGYSRTICEKKDPVGSNENNKKRMGVNYSGHHVPSVRKSKGRLFEVARSDKSRPTLFPKGSDPEYEHWRLHDAERNYVGPRQGDFKGTNDQLFDAYRKAYSSLNDIKVDVKSPNGDYILGVDVTPKEAIDLIQIWLKKKGLYS